MTHVAAEGSSVVVGYDGQSIFTVLIHPVQQPKLNMHTQSTNLHMLECADGLLHPLSSKLGGSMGQFHPRSMRKIVLKNVPCQVLKLC